MEDQSDRQQGDRQLLGRGAEQHPRGPRAQRQEHGLGLGPPLGEEQHGPAASKRRRDRAEHRVVPGGVTDALLTAQDRERADQSQEGTDQRVAEQRSGREDHERAGDSRHDEHRVHQRVVVVRSDDQRSPGRDVLAADHLDPPVEEAQQQPGEGADDPVAHGQVRGPPGASAVREPGLPRRSGRRPRGRHCPPAG